ncbi:hypothetical protein NHX12_018501 [Muraenolepis orangiensis]|uniref:Melanin-concentrating hormone receptor 1 n=1 Tax=Muraenolepis orangiensis TaxID=630683 RepID=A0A9Q0EWK8_9TELE|nr:hypothetical protein NHX12_018501 [Muraenolepis orangiensis]
MGRSAILLTILACFLGILMNCIVIHTIEKKNQGPANQTVPDIFIFNLSIADLLCLLSVPFLNHQLQGKGAWQFTATMCSIIMALHSNTQIVSTYVLTTMTVGRYLALMHHIRCNYIRTSYTARLAIRLVWAMSLFTIINIWMYTGLMPLPGGLMCYAVLLPNPSNDMYWFMLYECVCFFVLPLAIMGLALFKILQNMTTSVAPLPARSLRARIRRARMSLAICLAFFTCWVPYYILQLARLWEHNPSAFTYAYNIAICMGYTNGCINPFLYITLSETFKRRFMKVVQPLKRKMRVAYRRRWQRQA